MAFRPGELDQRITIKRKTRTPDGIGGQSFTWSDVSTVWALVRPAGGRESEDFDRLNAPARYLFVVRYPTPAVFRDEDAIEWDGELYNIRVLKRPKGRSLYMQIEAERGVAQ